MISKHETCNASLLTNKEKENGDNLENESLEKMYITGPLDDSEGKREHLWQQRYI